MPVLRLARAFREGASEVLILADDPIAPQEIAAFAHERGFALAEVQGEAAPAFLLQSGAVLPTPDKSG